MTYKYCIEEADELREFESVWVFANPLNPARLGQFIARDAEESHRKWLFENDDPDFCRFADTFYIFQERGYMIGAFRVERNITEKPIECPK